MRPKDTTEEAYLVQLAIWRRLGDRGTAELSIRMSEQAREIAMEGIRHRHPEYSDEQVRHAMYRLTLGDDLYMAAWPDRPLLAT